MDPRLRGDDERFGYFMYNCLRMPLNPRINYKELYFLGKYGKVELSLKVLFYFI